MSGWERYTIIICGLIIAWCLGVIAHAQWSAPISDDGWDDWAATDYE